MFGKLVSVTTPDSVRLHGFYAPRDDANTAWLLVHGVHGNFYNSELLNDVAKALYARKHPVLLINTRGHDSLSFNTGPVPMKLGAQNESIHASVLDLQAWVGFLESLGHLKVAMLGHSLGAVKSLLWASNNPAKLQKLVCVSPPRLATDNLLADPSKGPLFESYLDEAKSLCLQGKHDQIIRVRFPISMWVSAATYLDKYGSGNRYDYLALAHRIASPTLWTFGSKEVEGSSVNFRGADLQLAQVFEKSDLRHQSIRVLPEANHAYDGRIDELILSLMEWLND